MFPQDAPAPSQRCHWYWNDVGLLVHVPFCAVSVSPTFVVPVIDGRVVLVGGAAAAVAAQTKTDPAVIAKVVRIRLIFTDPFRGLPLSNGKTEGPDAAWL